MGLSMRGRNVIAAVKLVFRHSLAVLIMHKLYWRLSTALFVIFFLSTSWRIFCEHACGHRYLSHRCYRCTPWLLQLMALTVTARDLGPIFYWCFHHNDHHMHCDTGKDIHSPMHSSFLCVHFNFSYSEEEARRLNIEEKRPENCPRSFKKLQSGYDADLSWLNMRTATLVLLGDISFWVILGFALYNAGYDVWPFELWAWINFMPRVLTHHAIALTNSASHYFGTKPYTGRPDSPYPLCHATNCWWAAVLNFGEGWHSNHHAFALSARHGLLWWEVDVVYYGLCILGSLGLIWDMTVVHDSIRLAPRSGPIEKKPAVKYATMFPRKKQ